MFCKKCGKEIPDNTEFCNFCGAEQNSKIQSGTAAFTPKPKKRVGLIIGWILAVLGALSVFGSFTNGTYANFISLGMTLDDFFMVAIQLGVIGGGIYLIYKKRK